MRTYRCLIFAKHDGSDKAFLFTIDPLYDVKNGQRLLVETMHGETEAMAVGDSFMADDRAVNSIVTGTGAYFPLKKVIGTVETDIKDFCEQIKVNIREV